MVPARTVQSPAKTRKATRKVDTVISLVLYFVSKYVPGASEDVKFLVLALQPVFVTLIYAIAKEDAANASLG